MCLTQNRLDSHNSLNDVMTVEIIDKKMKMEKHGNKNRFVV
jgi:hypothetical protein